MLGDFVNVGVDNVCVCVYVLRDGVRNVRSNDLDAGKARVTYGNSRADTFRERCPRASRGCNECAEHALDQMYANVTCYQTSADNPRDFGIREQPFKKSRGEENYTGELE